MNNFDVISANLQTAGHGQFKRVWYSTNKNGGNCYITIVLKPDKTEHIGKLTQFASKMVAKTLTQYNLKPMFKYPNDVLIDGNSTEDVGELVIKDREMLSENGIVLISATISKKEKVLLVGPEVTTRGFIYVKDSSEMIEEIKRISLNIIERNITDTYIEYNKIKNEIREELGKYLYHETECKPMIIAVVQEV